MLLIGSQTCAADGAFVVQRGCIGRATGAAASRRRRDGDGGRRGLRRFRDEAWKPLVELYDVLQTTNCPYGGVRMYLDRGNKERSGGGDLSVASWIFAIASNKQARGPVRTCIGWYC